VNGPFVKDLGLELTAQGDIQTSQPFYSTNQSGVFAVGDCAVPIKVVVQAVATGTLLQLASLARSKQRFEY